MKTATLKLYALLTTIALLLIACGGGSGGTTGGTPQPPTPPPTPQAQSANGFSAVPGVSGRVVTSTASAQSFDWSLVPRANAQTGTTISVIGTWSGYCTKTPTSANGTAAIIVFGLGRLDGQGDCSASWFFAGSGISAGQSAAMNAGKRGQLVTGNGTLQGLIVTGSGGKQSDSGLVEIFVLRAGSILPTGLSCALGTGDQCRNTTTTFAVNNDDYIIATATVQPGDAIVNLRVMTAKQ